MSNALHRTFRHSRVRLKAIKVGLVRLKQGGREVCKHAPQIFIQFATFLFQLKKFVAIYPIKVAALGRPQFVSFGHVQCDPTQPERVPHHCTSRHALNGQTADDGRHGCKVGTDVGVQNRVAGQVYLKSCEGDHLPNLTAQVAERQKTGGIILMTPHFFQVQGTLVLSIDRKTRHRHSDDCSDTSGPSRPVAAGRRRHRMEFGAEITDTKAASSRCQEACAVRFHEIQYFHKEILS